MSKSYLMAVDMGVSFLKVGIYDIEGKAINITTKKVPGEYPRPGVFLQSADDYLKIIPKAIKESVENSKIDDLEIECIGFSAAMGGAMGIDKDWRIAADWSIISDTRFYPYALQMLKKDERKLLEKSGTNFPVFASKILWWKNEFPEVYKKVSKFLFLCGYIVGKLGNISIDEVFVDKSHLQWTALADLSNGTWSDELCEEFEIKIDKLPKIVNSYNIVSKLDKNMASLCGLRSGIPLIAGAGDKPAGTVGAGLVSNGLLIDESASFAALSLCIDKFVPDTKHKTLENLISPVDGYYLPSVFINGSGVTHEWFKNVFCEEEKKKANEINKNVFTLLDETAAIIKPGSDKLLSIGLLGGRGYPFDPSIRGMWINYGWSHKKEHFWRSLLESFAYEFAYVLNVMKDNYPGVNFNEIRVIGGASRSDLWNQIKCDVTGIPYVKLNRNDLTLLGDIIIAGYSIGIYKDIKEASKKFVIKTKKYLPNEVNHRYYKNFVDLYSGIFKKIRDIYVDLNNIPDF